MTRSTGEFGVDQVDVVLGAVVRIPDALVMGRLRPDGLAGVHVVVRIDVHILAVLRVEDLDMADGTFDAGGKSRSRHLGHRCFVVLDDGVLRTVAADAENL